MKQAIEKAKYFLLNHIENIFLKKNFHYENDREIIYKILINLIKVSQ